jgi:hypothetical protein
VDRRSSCRSAILLCAFLGCAPGFEIRVRDARIASGRLAAGPAIVSVFQFDSDGNLVPRADWTGTAARNVDAAVAARVGASGGRVFVAEDVAHTDVSYGDFRHWSSTALQEIAGKLAGTRDSPRRSVAEWRFPQSLATWRAALGADFVMAILFVDAYEPAGPGATTPPVAASYRATQTGIACAVDLGDGRIVWCETAPAFGDLRTRGAASDVVSGVVRAPCSKGC